MPSMTPSHLRLAALFSGPLVFLLILLGADILPGRPEATAMAAVVAWVALWWFTEPVDLAVTSLLPFLLLPLLGIGSPADTASQYMDPIIFLFLGGFMLAFAMERWHLHTRLALGILRFTGSAPDRILAGVMAAAFLLSMWVSNTATVLLLLPAVTALIGHIEGDEDKRGHHSLAVALLLGLAYAATLGGMSTLVGTPPNMYFYSFYQRTFPQDGSLHFASFFLKAGGITVLIALCTYALLHFRYLRRGRPSLPRDYFVEAFRALGPLHRDQRLVLLVFGLTVLAWFTRPDMQLGDTLLRGWASLSGLGPRVHDGMVAVLACLALFLLPARTQSGRLLEWRDVERLPYGIVLLFGSGFALANGFEQSGLSEWVAGLLGGFRQLHPLVLLIVLGLIITTVSEFASNIACVQLVLPIVASLDTGESFPLQGLLIATALFASMGFMMPVATPPNTIIFGSGRVGVADMARSGFWVNVSGVLIIALLIWLWYA